MLEAARTRLQEVQSETENLRRSVTELSANVEASGEWSGNWTSASAA